MASKPEAYQKASEAWDWDVTETSQRGPAFSTLVLWLFVPNQRDTSTELQATEISYREIRFDFHSLMFQVKSPPKKLSLKLLQLIMAAVITSGDVLFEMFPTGKV